MVSKPTDPPPDKPADTSVWRDHAAAPASSLRERAKDYLQIFAIIFAATWGIYEFVYKEILKPRYFTSITLESVTKAEIVGRRTLADGQRFVAVAISYSGKNTSETDVYIYILDISYKVYGYKLVNPRQDHQTDECVATFVAGMNACTRLNQCSVHFGTENAFLPNYCRVSVVTPKKHLVGAGRIFTMGQEIRLERASSMQRRYIIFVPEDVYDYLHVEVSAWLSKRRKPLKRIEWTADPDGDPREIFVAQDDWLFLFLPSLFHPSERKLDVRSLLRNDQDRAEFQAFMSDNEIFPTFSVDALPLWAPKPDAPASSATKP